YRDLFEKAVNDALAFSGALNAYTNERNTAQNMFSLLQSMPQELKAYAPDKVAAIEKRITELNTPTDPQSVRWQKYQEMINNNSIDDALEQVGKAPVEVRDQLYQQVAQKAVNSGDLARA